MEFNHVSVMLNECIDSLSIKCDGIYIDGTLGGGGHSSVILKGLKNGHLYAFDKDADAIQAADQVLKQISNNYTLIHLDNREMKDAMKQYGVDSVDGILLDLGVSSYQFDTKDRGFSYRMDARLDMRMDQRDALDAYQVVNHYSYERLCRIFYEYGEEPFSKQIARKICEKRQIKAIETTFELVDIIKEALPSKIKNQKGHPAKKVFQAIRIEVNNELEGLKCTLKTGLSLLKPKGRMVVITFHSLEDRIVKTIFHEAANGRQTAKGLVDMSTQTIQYRLVNKKPIVASEKEVNENQRAHSAKLRIIEKI